MKLADLKALIKKNLFLIIIVIAIVGVVCVLNANKEKKASLVIAAPVVAVK